MPQDPSNSAPEIPRPLQVVVALAVVGWLLFAAGSYWGEPVESWADLLLVGSPILLVLVIGALWRLRARWWHRLDTVLREHTDSIDGIPAARVGVWIALAAGTGLFAELMIIRLHSSYFQLFAYFKNVSLLSCFLGLGIGYTLGSRRPLATPLVLPLVALLSGVLYLLRYHPVAAQLQTPVSEQLGLGIDIVQTVSRVVAVYGFLAAVFALNALCFVPLGHLASRLMLRTEKLVSYSWNLAGSLGGILLFNLLSFLWAPPSVWFLAVTLLLLPFMTGRMNTMVPTAVAGVVIVALLGVSFQPNQWDVYSPYQVLTLTVKGNRPPEVRVNNVYYQRLLSMSQGSRAVSAPSGWTSHYAVPYQFKPDPESVLILGSGTGNDVSAALRFGAQEIDAVEIDPAIVRFGELLHPDSPYAAANVNVVVNDARAFVRRTDKKYDLIVYGLLDSHTLLSGQGGVRLDSYVYTVEAFREARGRLNEGGVIALTFTVINAELGRKLYLMLEQAFDGEAPVVYRTVYDQGYTFVIGEDVAEPVTAVAGEIVRRSTMFEREEIQADVSTDDWPFFYMPVRRYPLTYVAMVGLLLVLSLVMIRQFTPDARGSWSAPCFFLGAGFMLVETKGITELALVYGSTWVVVGSVIAGILIMAFLANLVVIRFGAPRPAVVYALLGASLLVGMFLATADLSAMPDWAVRVFLTGLLTLPLFFSGFAFSSEVKRTKSVAVALSSNLFGAMLGGFLEYNSMYFGFRSLYLLALAMYFLAFVTSVRLPGAVQGARTA